MIGAANVPGASEAEVKAAAQEISDKVGTTGDIGGSAIAGTVMGKLNKLISDIATHMERWTATRAGYIDTIKAEVSEIKESTATNGTGSASGTLSQKLTHIINLLTNGGVNEKLDEIANQTQNMSAIKSVQRGVVNISTNETASIDINTVNSNKCIVIVNGSWPIKIGGTFDYDKFANLPIVSTLTDNTLIIKRSTNSSYKGEYGTSVSWQIIEFY